MSKITRAYQKIFGGTGTTSDFGEFGSLAAGSPTTTKDPSQIQSLAAWLGGWAQATIGTLIPAYQDMNSVHYLAFYQICYLLQMGIAEWDNQTSYYIGSVIQYNGLFYVSLQDANVNEEPDMQPSFWQQGLPGAEITGVIKQYAGVTAPSGYFICDGTAKSRTTYAGLFAVIGTIYGIGDGTTTFNIPDLRTRVAAGYSSGDDTFGTLGNSGGEKKHQLTVDELASHNHSVGVGINTNAGNLAQQTNNNNNSFSTGSTGGDVPHNNLQPYLTLNQIIKY